MEPDVKKWYLSKTVIASLLAAVGTASQIFGWKLPFLANPALADQIVQVVTLVSTMSAGFFRLNTTTKVTM